MQNALPQRHNEATQQLNSLQRKRARSEETGNNPQGNGDGSKSVHGQGDQEGFKEVTVALPGCRPQKFKVCVGNDPHDIQAWIRERKERFPTRANIYRRQQEQQQRKSIPGQQSSNSIANSAGPSDTQTGKRQKVEGSVVNTALGDLMAAYGSSSDDSEDETTQGVGKGKVESCPATEKSVASSPGIATERGDHIAGIHKQILPQPPRNNDRRQVEGRKTGWKQRKPKRGVELKSTALLQKLLDQDIKREAGLTLQCLSFIVQKNFLQPQNKTGM
jgi:hypothetical protein